LWSGFPTLPVALSAAPGSRRTIGRNIAPQLARQGMHIVVHGKHNRVAGQSATTKTLTAAHELKHPLRDGTTHVCCTGTYECRGRQDAGSGLFEPLDFMYRMYGMPRAQGCAGAATYRMYGMPRAQGCAGAATCRKH